MFNRPGLVTHGRLSQAIHGVDMGTSLWVFVAVVICCVGWFGYEVVRLLKEIADELRHIRRYLEGVSGELEKISGPLGDVKSSTDSVSASLVEAKRSRDLGAIPDIPVHTGWARGRNVPWSIRWQNLLDSPAAALRQALPKAAPSHSFRRYIQIHTSRPFEWAGDRQPCSCEHPNPAVAGAVFAEKHGMRHRGVHWPPSCGKKRTVALN